MRSTTASMVWFLRRSREGLGEVAHFAVDAGAEALLVELIEQVFELAFAAADDGGHDGDALAHAELEDALDDLFGGLAGDGAAAVGAVGRADRGVEQAQVVVDLGDGADGGAGAAAGGFLLDGDGGLRPSMESTSGRSIWSRNWRA
jgi:hypothetical protein